MKQRIYYLDYLRVLACLMIMVIHACEYFYIGPDGGILIRSHYDALLVTLIDGFCHSAVPLFVITSSYLLLPVKGTTTEFFKRRADRIIVPFLIWSVLYCVLPMLWGGMSVDESLSGLYRIVYNFNGFSGHLWFVCTLVGLYLFMPVLSPWLKTVSRRGEQAFLVVWLVASTYHYAKLLWGDEIWGEAFWNEFHTFYYFSGYIGYMVLGHYIKVYTDWSKARLLTVGASLAMVGAAVTWLITYHRMTLGSGQSFYMLEIGWRFCSVNMIVITAGVFLMMKAISSPGRAYPLVENISNLSYGMYLMHIFILNWMIQLIVPHFGTLSSIVLVGASTFVLSYAVCKLLSVTPLGKAVVGYGR